MVRIRFGNEERVLSWEEWESWVAAGRIPPDTLVCLDAVSGGEYVRAGDLELYRDLRNEQKLSWKQAWTLGGPCLATLVLVGLQVRLWWWARIPEVRERVIHDYTAWAPPTWENGEIWRLFTMGLLHVDLMHLTLNMAWLAYLGWNLERALGWRNLLLLYFGAVLGGSMASVLGAPWNPSLGASGGIFGLIGAAVVFGLLRSDILPERGRRIFGWALVPYLVVMLLTGLTSATVDNWSHVGGLVTGGILAIWLDPEPLQRKEGWNRRARFLSSGLAVGLLAIPLVLGPRIQPLVTSEQAHAELQRLRDGQTHEPEPSGSLGWKVPVGWRTGTGESRIRGFVSPTGERFWTVRTRRLRQPSTADEMAEQWLTGLPFDAVDPQVDSVELAGQSGVRVRVTAPEARLEWQGVVRGRHVLEAIWEAEPRRDARVRPLRDRLFDSVRWDEPEALVAARRALDRAPTSHRAKLRLVSELVEHGHVEEAFHHLQALLDDRPQLVDAWLELLNLTARHPEVVAEPEGVWAEALAQTSDPRVLVRLAETMEAHDRTDAAAALLLIGLEHAPGDRGLRGAIRRRGHPLLSSRRVVEEPTPLTLEAVQARADALAQARADRIEALQGADPAELPRHLLALRHHTDHPPETPAALAGLGEELRTLEQGGELPWLPERAAAHVRAVLEAHPELPDRLIAAGRP